MKRPPSSVFSGFTLHRRQRDRHFDQLRLVLVCGAIAILWLSQLGQQGGGLPPNSWQAQAQLWLEQWHHFPAIAWNEILPPGRSPLTVITVAWGLRILPPHWGPLLPAIILNLLSLPCLYWLSKTLLGKSSAALLSVIVYGTSFGVLYGVRLEPAQSLMMGLTIFSTAALLFCRLDYRGSLLWGLTLTALVWTDWRLGGILLVTGLSFLQWDTPRLLRTFWFWIGLGLGLWPAIAWGMGEMVLGNSFATAIPGSAIEDSFLSWPQGYWFLLGNLPSLIFALTALQQTRQAWQWSWGRFFACHIGLYGGLCLITDLGFGHQTKFPLLIFVAIAAAKTLAECRQPTDQKQNASYPLWWRSAFGVISLVLFLALLSLGYQYLWVTPNQPLLMPSIGIMAFLGLTLVMTTSLLMQRRAEFIYILFWGLYVSLLLLVNTPLWPSYFVDVDVNLLELHNMDFI